MAAWRISAASRTAPERGVGVFTTSRTSPDAISVEDPGPRRWLARPPPELGDGLARRSPSRSSVVARAGRRRQPVARRPSAPPPRRSSPPLSRSAIDSSASGAPALRRASAGRDERRRRGAPWPGPRADPRAIPMTSPVDCMNGPTDGSTPRSLAVENAGALTATNGGGGSRPPDQPMLGERRAERDPDRQLDHRDAGHLGQERDRARGARVDLDEVDAVLADDELGVDEALRTRGPGTIRSIVETMSAWSPSLTRLGREHADRIAASGRRPARRARAGPG